MTEARERSRKTGGDETSITLPPDAIAKLRHLGIRPTREENKFGAKPVSATVRAIWNGADFDEIAHIGRDVAVILDHTNHYAESGGQVGDRGELMSDVADFGATGTRGRTSREAKGDCRVAITDTLSFGGYVLHVGRVIAGRLQVGDKLQVNVDRKVRAGTMGNHTATHLLNHALRAVLGDEVEQSGSLVAPDRLRFDFRCSRAMKPDEIARTETLVNEAIARDVEVFAAEASLEAARAIRGVRAVFGERYPDPVRVVSIGQPVSALLERPDAPEWEEVSVEFCGGTHVARTVEAQRFVIVQETALAAGVRRIFALTGVPALAATVAGEGLVKEAEAAAALDGDELVAAHDLLISHMEPMTIGVSTRHALQRSIEAMRDRIKVIRKSAESSARTEAVDQARAVAAAPDVVQTAPGGSFLVVEIPSATKESLRSAADVVRSQHPDAAFMLFSANIEEGSVAIIAAVPKPLIAAGLKAGDWVRVAATACGGGGGGRPDAAQAGGRQPEKVPEAMDTAREFATQMLA